MVRWPGRSSAELKLSTPNGPRCLNLLAALSLMPQERWQFLKISGTGHARPHQDSYTTRPTKRSERAPRARSGAPFRDLRSVPTGTEMTLCAPGSMTDLPVPLSTRGCGPPGQVAVPPAACVRAPQKDIPHRRRAALAGRQLRRTGIGHVGDDGPLVGLGERRGRCPRRLAPGGWTQDHADAPRHRRHGIAVLVCRARADSGPALNQRPSCQLCRDPVDLEPASFPGQSEIAATSHNRIQCRKSQAL